MNENSDKAQNEIDIKKIEQVEINQDNDKMILLLYKDKLYKLEADSKDYIEEWYKSIALVKSKTDDYLNLDRYIDMNIFKKVTGKSLFRNFEEILEEHFKDIEEQKRREQEEIDRKRNDELQMQNLLEEQKIASKKAAKIKGNKATGKKTEESISPEVRLFKKTDVDKRKGSSSSSDDKNSSKYGETEVRLKDDNDVEMENDIEFNIELRQMRSTAVNKMPDSDQTNSDLSSLKLYRNNTESDLTKYKVTGANDKKELMQFTDLIKRHESISSDSSGKGSDNGAQRRSATRKELTDAKKESKDDTGYSGSNMNNLNIKKKNITEKKEPVQSKG
eukprot:CAMPEP_0168339302 /NCGR_PEP_ID=MMETSP0213-20121227/13377_1 /TAXON_ID=151035 /ORGANISM="Euplotes harpa, Strain FSP1.4" /LENGTH=332 /DNA_ID=CAMNT_0008345301 /DNA_START=35 /DNA_END=1032 /DNA_ORIENTATION=-